MASVTTWKRCIRRSPRSAQGTAPLKLRLTLAPDGLVEIAAFPYEPFQPQTVWRIAVAETRLKHDDALLRHKTTRRQAYISAREEYSSAEVDEVILLNERGEVCEGTITSIFLDIGGTTCVTLPFPVACSMVFCGANF